MSDGFAVEGKHALVTGASSGLGRHFALFLASRGARVTVAARRAEAIEKTVEKIHADKGQAQGLTMDVKSPRSIDAALTLAEQGFGPVEILVNNAGVTSTKPALEEEEADWDHVVDTNLKESGLPVERSAGGWRSLNWEDRSSTSPRSWDCVWRAPSRPTPSQRLGLCK